MRSATRSVRDILYKRMYKLLTDLGFKANPFGSYVAEKEPNLEQYIVRPAYFKTILERTSRSESFILFGARGAGKSATRIALYKECWNSVQRGQSAPLAVTLDSFSGLLSQGLKSVTLATYIREFAFLVVEAVLVWLAALEEGDRAAFTNAMDKDEERLAVMLVRDFYLSQNDMIRRVATTKALQLLDQAWHDRSSLWIQKKWDGLAGLVASIAAALVKKATGSESSVESPLKSLVGKTKPDSVPEEGRYAFEIVDRLMSFARMFGFSGIVVLTDKADETEHTNASTEATARLLYPLLANTRLLESDGLSWIFFVWNRVREHYGAGDMPVRLDKIANAEIAWDKKYLEELIDRRIDYFSGGSVRKISDVLTKEVDLAEIIELSMDSPRELIRIFDTILRENDERDIEASRSLSPEAVTRGLDKYSREFVENTFDRTVYQSFIKLAKTEFTNHEVQAAFRINDDSARNKIRNWVLAGFVAQTGTRPSGETGGKPAHEFGIADKRLRRVVARQLTSLSTFDAAEDVVEGDVVLSSSEH